MDRVSSQMTPRDMQYYMRRNGVRTNEMTNKVAGNTRVLDPRDDPSAASHSVLLSSKIDRLQTFVDNAEQMKDDIRLAENSLQQANTILHDVRRLAVTAANGTYSESDRKIMANQLNEYLYGLIDLANTRNEDGIALFSGTRRSPDAFKAIESSVEGSGHPVVVSVEYIGDNGGRTTEISDGRFAEFANAGDHLFWANYDRLYSPFNALGYRVLEDSAIMIDGKTIPLAAGDNIHTIINKINQADLRVRAYFDEPGGSITLEATEPHQIWLEDEGAGTVLSDLGFIEQNQLPPYNLAGGVIRSGGSVFDEVIRLRDQLYKNNALDAGGKGLKGISIAQDNLLTKIAHIGNLEQRLDTVVSRLTLDIPQYADMNNRQLGKTPDDLAQSIVEMQDLQNMHKATLQTTAKVLQPTLMDFLR